MWLAILNNAYTPYLIHKVMAHVLSMICPVAQISRFDQGTVLNWPLIILPSVINKTKKGPTIMVIIIYPIGSSLPYYYVQLMLSVETPMELDCDVLCSWLCLLCTVIVRFLPLSDLPLQKINTFPNKNCAL